MQNLLPHHVMSKGPVDHGHVSQIACQGTMVVERVSRCVEVQMRSDLDGFPAEIVDDAVEDRWRNVVESPTARREGRSYDRYFGRSFRLFGYHPLLVTGKRY
jgi:hypothetical protein